MADNNDDDNEKDEIEKSLGLNPLSVYDPKAPAIRPKNDVTENTDVTEDYDESRNDLKRASEYAFNAMQDLARIAEGSQHPKAYEALTGAIKAFADISESKMDIHLKMQRLGKDTDSQDSKTVNNNLIVTTEDLIRKISQQTNPDQDDQ